MGDNILLQRWGKFPKISGKIFLARILHIGDYSGFFDLQNASLEGDTQGGPPL